MRQAGLPVVEPADQLRRKPEAYARLAEGPREAVVRAAIGKPHRHAGLVRVRVGDGARIDRRLRPRLRRRLPERDLQPLGKTLRKLGDAFQPVALAHERDKVRGRREVGCSERIVSVAPGCVDDRRERLDVDDVVGVEAHAAQVVGGRALDVVEPVEPLVLYLAGFLGNCRRDLVELHREQAGAPVAAARLGSQLEEPVT